VRTGVIFVKKYLSTDFLRIWRLYFVRAGVYERLAGGDDDRVVEGQVHLL
jgi:hypothetical protein